MVKFFNQALDALTTTTISIPYVDRIIDSITDTLIVIDPKATITKTNQATTELLGFTKEELVSKHFSTLVTLEAYQSIVIDALQNKADFISTETVYIAQDGRRIPVSVSASVVRDEQQEIQGIVCIAHDLTCKESEERYALAACATNDGLWDWNLSTDKIYL